MAGVGTKAGDEACFNTLFDRPFSHKRRQFRMIREKTIASTSSPHQKNQQDLS
jgi:hypothetical protein